MDQVETAKVMSLLSAAYPYFYSKQTRDEKTDALMLWSDMFTEEPLEVVLVAIKSLIANHSDFPPTIADVKKEYQRIVSAATNEMSNEKLWKIYTKAISNGTYGSKEEFEKLPPVLQRYCGSSNHLRDMATVETEILNTVTRGQFAKQLEIAKERERYSQSLPPATKNLICGMVGKFKMEELGDGN